MAIEDWPDLVTPEVLSDFPGAPFNSATVKSAAAQVRRTCGWHIAPSLTETLTLDHDGGRVLHLPSLRVTNVTSVRDMTLDVPREVTGWRWSGAGMVEGSFPRGFRAVEVTLTHGFEDVPDDLLPVIAARTRRRAMQESLAGRSVSFSAEGDRIFETALDMYRLGARP